MPALRCHIEIPWSNCDWKLMHFNGDNRQNEVGFRRYYLEDQWSPSRYCVRTACGIDVSPVDLAYAVFTLEA